MIGGIKSTIFLINDKKKLHTSYFIKKINTLA